MFENITDLRKSNNTIILYSTLALYIILIINIIGEKLFYNVSNTYCISYIALLAATYLSIYITAVKDKLSKYLPLVVSICYLTMSGYGIFTLNAEFTWLFTLPFAVISVLLYRTVWNLIVTYLGLLVFNCLDLYNDFKVVGWENWGSLHVEYRMTCIIFTLVLLIVLSNVLNKYELIIRNVYRESSIDQVSGLKSESFVEKRLAPMINSNINITYTMVMINIDKFSQFNATYGNILGDKVLNRVGYIIKEELDDIKANVNSCRLYGDKFIIVFTNRNFEEVSEYYKTIKNRLNTLIIRNQGNEIVISTTVSVTDTRLCEHTYISLYNRMRFLQDIARQKGMNKLIEDSIDFHS